MPLKGVQKEDATIYHLPGRDWLYYLGPDVCEAKNITLGFSIFPAGSAPEGHIHDNQEEAIYVVAGRGELVTPEGIVSLEPGTSVFVPSGLLHSTVSNGPGPLELVTAFSPPVIPGSYEKSSRIREG